MGMPSYKSDLEEIQTHYLAPYATIKPRESSRDHKEKPVNTETRTEFQRDRDRIIHSKAFRRLMYKTQVFVNQEGDHYRTRLTHSLEVAQMARGIARSLRLNEDLVEAIALGHDLGHTPYGHAVEEQLAEFLKLDGGFFHNEQSVRMVELLEEKDGLPCCGLNLTWEVREGILKHTKDSSGICQHLMPNKLPSLEGQVVRMADTIAYVTHDLEDGFTSGLFRELVQYKILSEHDIESVWERFGAERSLHVSSIINKLIVDVTDGTQDAINEIGICTPEDARNQTELVVRFKMFKNEFHWLKDFVKEHIYNGSLASIMDTKAKRIIIDLYTAYIDNPKQLPPNVYYKFINPNKTIFLDNSYPATKNRVICDFLSGLTDRHAAILHNKLFNEGERIISSN